MGRRHKSDKNLKRDRGIKSGKRKDVDVRRRSPQKVTSRHMSRKTIKYHTRATQVASHRRQVTNITHR